MDNNSLSHTTWNCKYHIVFAPKFRRKVIYGELKQDIANILSMLCKRKEVYIVQAEACPDPYPYASRDTAENECIGVCRISEREKYVDDI